MHIKRMFAEDFKRFTKIEIVDIPAAAKLVVLAGPNGNGKSSLFDLMMHYWTRHVGGGIGWNSIYHAKISDPEVIPPPDRLDIEFHELQRPADLHKMFYFRSAFRNDPEFASAGIERAPPMLRERRFHRLIDNDAVVRLDFQRLYAAGLEAAFEDDENMTLRDFRKKLLGDIKDSLEKVMPELVLESLGNPFKVQTFRFSKGVVKNFNYMNLSGGEKAAFDLLLDYTIKKQEFDDTVFCIDEPEAHLNPRVHGKMLEQLMNLTEANNQLWIATHSIGMMRRARDLYHQKPGEIAFLDFEVDFDQPQVLKPVVPDRALWQRSLETALDDLASLVSPKIIIACESGKPDGKPGEGIDAAIYNSIFEEEFPEARFVSIGSSTDMKGDRFLVVQAVAGLVQGVEVLRVIDRDGMSDEEVEEHEKKGYRVLGRRQIESYMFDDEVLGLLCASAQQPEKSDDLLRAKAAAVEAAKLQGHQPDDIKKASGRIAEACRKILMLKNAGKTTGAFMRDTLAPLIGPKVKIYEELKEAIFGKKRT
jgi:energy-coupling factor transporter ATP-binding protein EcfA2